MAGRALICFVVGVLVEDSTIRRFTSFSVPSDAHYASGTFLAFLQILTVHPEHFCVPSDAHYASGIFITTTSQTSVCFGLFNLEQTF